MGNENFNEQHHQNHLRVRKILRIDHIEDSEKPNTRRERFVALLEKRHGYTNEKAVDEFERLLKQSHRKDRISGFPQERSNSKHPLSE